MSRSVLIVEDEELIRDLCADVFKDAGYTVSETSTGDEALELLSSGVAVDLIVTDIRMPGAIDGMALRREVEANWPHMKMLITSGHMTVERAELTADQLFVPKPYKFLELVRQAGELLDSRA